MTAEGREWRVSSVGSPSPMDVSEALFTRVLSPPVSPAPAPSRSLTYLLESSLYLSLFFTCHVSSITRSCRFSRGLPEAALPSSPVTAAPWSPRAGPSRWAFPAHSRAPPLPSVLHTRHGRVSQAAALCPLTAGVMICHALPWVPLNFLSSAPSRIPASGEQWPLCVVFGNVPHGSWHAVGTIRVREQRAVGSAANSHGIGISEASRGVFGPDLCTLMYLKWVTSKDPLNSAGNSVACHVTIKLRKASDKGTCGAQHCTSAVLQYKTESLQKGTCSDSPPTGMQRPCGSCLFGPIPSMAPPSCGYHMWGVLQYCRSRAFSLRSDAEENGNPPSRTMFPTRFGPRAQ